MWKGCFFDINYNISKFWLVMTQQKRKIYIWYTDTVATCFLCTSYISILLINEKDFAKRYTIYEGTMNIKLNKASIFLLLVDIYISYIFCFIVYQFLPIERKKGSQIESNWIKERVGREKTLMCQMDWFNFGIHLHKRRTFLKSCQKMGVNSILCVFFGSLS